MRKISSYIFRHCLCAITREAFTVVKAVLSKWSIVCSTVTHLQHINPLNAKLNPICHFLALLGAHHILHVIMTRVKGTNNNLQGESSSLC